MKNSSPVIGLQSNPTELRMPAATCRSSPDVTLTEYKLLYHTPWRVFWGLHTLQGAPIPSSSRPSGEKRRKRRPWPGSPGSLSVTTVLLPVKDCAASDSSSARRTLCLRYSSSSQWTWGESKQWAMACRKRERDGGGRRQVCLVELRRRTVMGKVP